MIRTVSALLLLLLFAGFTAPAAFSVEDDCSSEQITDSGTITANHCQQSSENSGSEPHSPCDCPIHHQSCCQAQFVVRPLAIWQGLIAEQAGFFTAYSVSFASPALEGPFQPPKA